eukprot:GHVS01108499.1.p2 GENE.GHVS01108499.1~~GHVS01108499.1.p2  ORF type:complete len:109 (+),score=13.88 GHVS01108499.1:341-667(+)
MSRWQQTAKSPSSSCRFLQLRGDLMWPLLHIGRYGWGPKALKKEEPVVKGEEEPTSPTFWRRGREGSPPDVDGFIPKDLLHRRVEKSTQENIWTYRSSDHASNSPPLG